jgi:hypothetical protein
MLLVCIRICLKSVLRYKFLIFGTYHPNTLYLREKDVRIRSYYPKPKGVREQQSLGSTWYHCLLPGVSSSVTDLHVTLDTSLSATLNPRMSFVTPSVTHNKPAAFSGSAMFTHSRKLLVAQNRTRLQVCLHCVPPPPPHTNRNTKRESSQR